MSSPLSSNAIMPRPMTFLTLAPATSSSYPQPQRPRAPTLEAVEGAPERPAGLQRRSSSSASSTGFRILKLGPVHWGEHPEDNKTDFVDVPSP